MSLDPVPVNGFVNHGTGTKRTAILNNFLKNRGEMPCVPGKHQATSALFPGCDSTLMAETVNPGRSFSPQDVKGGKKIPHFLEPVGRGPALNNSHTPLKCLAVSVYIEHQST